jgi:hypothetical protein
MVPLSREPPAEDALSGPACAAGLVAGSAPGTADCQTVFCKPPRRRVNSSIMAGLSSSATNRVIEPKGKSRFFAVLRITGSKRFFSKLPNYATTVVPAEALSSFGESGATVFWTPRAPGAKHQASSGFSPSVRRNFRGPKNVRVSSAVQVGK